MASGHLESAISFGLFRVISVYFGLFRVISVCFGYFGVKQKRESERPLQDRILRLEGLLRLPLCVISKFTTMRCRFIMRRADRHFSLSSAVCMRRADCRHVILCLIVLCRLGALCLSCCVSYRLDVPYLLSRSCLRFQSGLDRST